MPPRHDVRGGRGQDSWRSMDTDGHRQAQIARNRLRRLRNLCSISVYLWLSACVLRPSTHQREGEAMIASGQRSVTRIAIRGSPCYDASRKAEEGSSSPTEARETR